VQLSLRPVSVWAGGALSLVGLLAWISLAWSARQELRLHV
jgi:hypothetical protein